MSGRLPKAHSKAFRKLWLRIQEAFDLAAMSALAYAVLDRDVMEGMVLRLTSGRQDELDALPKAALVSQLVMAYGERADAAWELINGLDGDTVPQRALVASMPADQAAERLGRRRALHLRRHGARLIWAVGRDGREAVWPLARSIAKEYVQKASRLDDARRRARDSGAERELVEVEEMYREIASQLDHLEVEISGVEKQRARLGAEAVRREAKLKRQSERSEKLASQLASKVASLESDLRAGAVAAKAVPSEPGVPHVSAPPKSRTGETKNPGKDRRAGHASDNKRLQDYEARLQEATADNERMRATIERLRELRSRERVMARESSARQDAEVHEAEPTRSAPMVESPRKSRARSRGAACRVGVFIDVANISGAARRLFGRAVDFPALVAVLVGDRQLAEVRAYAIDKGPGFKNFAASLHDAGFQVLGKRPKEFADGTVKADWDVGIAVDILMRKESLDVIILVSGDGDFVPVLRALRRGGTGTEVAAFTERAAKELKGACDELTALDEAVLLT